MLVSSSSTRSPALRTHGVSRLFAGVPSFAGEPLVSRFVAASHPSHCLKFFGGSAATSSSLRSIAYLCLSLGDDHASSEAVGKLSRRK
jgi:hypothetical protein